MAQVQFFLPSHLPEVVVVLVLIIRQLLEMVDLVAGQHHRHL
jgi:hypothetical protein